MNTKRFSLTLWGLVTTMALGAGCGLTPASDIDRVQPNYSDKSMFEGEWHSRMVVVDKQYPNGWLFEGYEGGLDRIRWEITQNQLIAHRSYEYAPGTEQDDPGDNTVIASFTIDKHFDISRQYNATNGVELNVIEENDYDRPWWDRQYMRVDWSKDVSAGFDGTFWRLSGLINTMTAVANDRNSNADPADPFKVRVSDDYIETTLDFIAHPDWRVCSGLGAEAFSCQGANIKAKWSFNKIDKTDDYEAMDYPDRKSMMFGFQTNAFGDTSLCFEGDEGCDLRELWVHDNNWTFETCDTNIHDPDDCFQYTQDMFSRFGFFRTERFAYDRENGVTLSSREQLINRWDIWQDSYDDNGNLIPYADRTPKTITYVLNVGFPEGMKQATQEQADDWNIAFLDTIANLQGKTMEQVENDYAKGGQPFRGYEVVENSCNPAAVNEFVEFHKANGKMYDLEMDLMKHDIRLKDLGAGNLENACAVLEHYSKENGLAPVFHWEQLGDLRYSFINWIANPEPAGPLGYGPSAADPITGEIVSANANIYGASLDTYANWGGDIVQLLNEDLDVNDIINGSHIRQYVDSVREKRNQETDPRIAKAAAHLMDERTAHLTDEQFLPRIPVGSLNNNLNRLRDSNFEEEYLLNEDAVRLFAGDSASPNGQYDQATMQAAMPSSWGKTQIPSLFNANQLAENIQQTEAQMQTREAYQSRRDLYNTESFCFFHEEIEPAVLELATELKDVSRDEAVQIIRAGIMRGVLAHEVGHTVGLRHNFEGSSDPMNYFPGYWDHTTNDHRDSHVTRKSELEYSSIMDYHQRFNSDFAGIGLYDKAAIKFGYGELIEVFDQRNEAFVAPNFPADAFWLFYPKDIPYLLAGTDAHATIRTRYEEINDEITYDGQNEGVLDIGELDIEPKVENIFKRRNVKYSEWSRQDVMRVFGVPNADQTPHHADVPYSYCSDGFAWGGNLTCNRFDKGATSQEIIRNASEMYDFYYPFYTYLGARSDLSMNGWMSRLYDRTYQPMRNAFTYYFYYRRSTALIYPTFLDWALAAHDGLNFLGGVIQRPDVGTYCEKDGMYVPQTDLAAGEACTAEKVVPLGPGREFDTHYTPDEIFRPQNIGHVWDKVLALSAITSNDAFFYRDFSNQVDRSAFSISFYRVFQDEMNDLFTGLILDKPTSFAPRLNANANVETGNELLTTPLVTFRDITDVPTEGTMIKPATNYYMRRMALVWSMLNFSSQLDQTLDFSKRAKISLVGSSNDPVFEGVPEATFTDPHSLIDYHSYAVDGNERSLGFALLTDAQEFVDNDYVAGDPASESELNDKLEMIDMVRYLTDILEVANN